MQLINQATAGIDKQIKDLELAIKELKAEKREMLKDFGVPEHPLRQIIKKHKRLQHLKPPTDEQCQTLYDLYGEAKIVEMMEKMNNWKDITKNVYFYLTITNWLKRDSVKATPTGRQIKDDEYRKPIEEAKEQTAAQPEITKGWLTEGIK